MFAKRLRRLRESKGYTSSQVSEYLGLSRSAIANYENNFRKPKSDAEWLNLAHFFDVSVDYLMGEEIKYLSTEEIYDLLGRGLISKNDIPETKMSNISISDTPVTHNTDIKPQISETKQNFINYIHSTDLTDEQIEQIKTFVNAFILKI